MPWSWTTEYHTAWKTTTQEFVRWKFITNLTSCKAWKFSACIITNFELCLMFAQQNKFNSSVLYGGHVELFVQHGYYYNMKPWNSPPSLKTICTTKIYICQFQQFSYFRIHVTSSGLKTLLVCFSLFSCLLSFTYFIFSYNIFPPLSLIIQFCCQSFQSA